MTPFGSPVLPLEKITVARSSKEPGSLAADRSLERAGRREPGQGKRPQLLSETRLGGDLLEQQRATGQLHLHAVEKRLGRDDGLQVALAGAGSERLLGERVVEVDRHFPHQQRGEVDERAGDGRRQQNADHLLARPVGAESPGQENGLGQRPTET